ncbi:MAG TPA: trypsin-like peptidase domain-containing protein [Anaerolineales bacterium]|nr:trypsin-like peptidase domain-containing protein [Anaerolineales bacterium]
MKRVLLILSILILASLACQTTALPTLAQPTLAPANQVSPPILPELNNPSENEERLVALYAQVIPGVVSLNTGRSQGSGFVFDSNGHIITNQHVVDGASEVEVAFTSGYKAYGTVIGADADADIAVVKVEAPTDQIYPLAIGDSSQLQVGQSVVAIGNPFGLNGTMTVGIVSGLGRTQFAHASPEGGFFSTADIIQTDAAINPGNSGGPLFNMNGEVVGVNQSIRTENVNEITGNAVNSGVGFSISINLAKRVAQGLIEDGNYEYPYLGISSRDDLSLAEIEALGLNTYTGAYVATVTEGGPADQAGIRGGTNPTSLPTVNAGGDVITAIDGVPVNNFDQLLSYLVTNKAPGETVTLTVLREGQTLDVPVTLGERP